MIASVLVVCGGGLTIAAIGAGLYFYLKDREA